MTALILALSLIVLGPRPQIASWYADPRAPQGALYAAVPHWSGHPYYLTVRAGQRHVRVRVIDSCECYVGTKDARGRMESR